MSNETVRAPRKIRIVIPDAKRHDKENYTVEELYNEYGKFLKRRFTSLCGTREDGEDLTHDVFERVVKHWDKIQLEKIEAALAVICHNCRYDWIAKKYNRPQLIAVDDILEFDSHDYGISDPFRILLNERSMEQVLETTSVLSETQGQVFRLYFVDGQTVGDIAAELKCKPNVVYSALASTKKLMNDLCHKPTYIEELSWKTSS